MTTSETATNGGSERPRTLADAVEEVFKLWVESKDGVVTRRTIDSIAVKHEVDPKALGSAWENFLAAMVTSSSKKKQE